MGRRGELTKIILVTGFLGSGKTSLLNGFIRGLKDKKLGIMVNDFGAVAVDDEILKNDNPALGGNGQSIIKIENGSIFCSCRRSALYDALEYYRKIRPDYLLIETSGISDPSAINDIMAEKRSADCFELVSVVCLADASTFLKTCKLFNFIRKQIINADLVLLNKTDLVGKEDIDLEKKLVREWNDRAEIVETVYSRISPDIFKPRKKTRRDLPEEDIPGRDKPLSYTVWPVNIGPLKLERVLDEVKEKIFRVKGFLSHGNTAYLVNGAAGNIAIEKANRKPEKYSLSFIFDKYYEADVKRAIHKINGPV